MNSYFFLATSEIHVLFLGKTAPDLWILEFLYEKSWCVGDSSVDFAEDDRNLHCGVYFSSRKTVGLDCKSMNCDWPPDNDNCHRIEVIF